MPRAYPIRLVKDKLSFVSVIVDGDGMNVRRSVPPILDRSDIPQFLESLVQEGKDGGDKAARLLIEASESHVQSTDPAAPSNTCYKIRVYANVAGLTKAYRTDKILDYNQDLTSFIQGFNKAHPLCDFVDVGDGKECGDAKVRGRSGHITCKQGIYLTYLAALLERDHVDVHCQRVLFCASADNGYAPVLRQYRVRNRISLVEGPPFARYMKELTSDFKTTSFPNVFMSRKLNETPRVPSGPASPVTNTAIISTGSPTPNYASAAARPAPALQFPLPLTKGCQESRISLKLSLYVNDLEQRVDRPLKQSPKQALASLKARKLCNRFHILGECPYGMVCTHNHKFVPSDQEIVDLMYIARSTPCGEGVYCRDVKCISGHRCAFGESCVSKHECRFDLSMHGVPLDSFRRIEEYPLD